MTGLIIVLFWIVMALFSRSLTQDPNVVNAFATLKAPSAAHWFGTDDLGRDVFARTLAGARTVLIIAPLATLLCLLAGGIIGLVAGFYRGLVDEIIMRLVDVLLSLPVIITAILILSLLGKSIPIVIIVVGALFTRHWPSSVSVCRRGRPTGASRSAPRGASWRSPPGRCSFQLRLWPLWWWPSTSSPTD